MKGKEIIKFIQDNKLEEGEVSICVNSNDIDPIEYWESYYETRHFDLHECKWNKPHGLLISSVM